MNWTFEQHKQFIVLLRENPILWDTQHPEFLNRQKREEAWSSIQANIRFPVFEIKMKLSFFRSKYCEIYKKTLRDPNYKPNWQFFKALKFLFKHEDKEQDSLESLINDDTENSLINSYTSFEDETYDREISHFFNTDNNENVAKITNPKDEYTIFGESIANELRIMNNFKTVKLAFKSKVMTAIFEANEAVKRKKLECI